MNKATMKKIVLLILFTVLLFVGLQKTAMVAAALHYLFGLIAPFLIGGCIAFILNVPLRFIEDKLFSLEWVEKHRRLRKMKRAISLLLTLAVVSGVIAIVSILVVPELYNSLSKISDELPMAKVKIPEWIDMISGHLPMFAKELADIKENFLHTDWQKIGSMIVEFLRNGSFLSDTYSFASSIANGLVNAVIGFVFAIYLLAQKENLSRQCRKLLYSCFSERHVDRFLDICGRTSGAFSSFLSGQCLEATILGLMFFIVMSIFQMPYAIVISVLIAVTALIPVFGALIGCIVGALLILIISPIQALWFVIIFLILQQVEGNLIYPHVVGNSVGLPSIWVLTAVTLGANLAGVLGMLFAIPAFSVLYSLLREFSARRTKDRNIDPEKLK